MAIHLVANSIELSAAFAKAKGGDQILLVNAGSRYAINEQGTIRPSSEIVVKSADPRNPAVIEDVFITNARNLRFDGVTFDSSATGATRADWRADFNLASSENVSIVNSTMRGTATSIRDGNPATVVAEQFANIHNVKGFTFENNEMSHYSRGLRVRDSDDIFVIDNDISLLQGDALQFTESQNVHISGNYIHDFLGSYYNISHDDMIQFWSVNAKRASGNIYIHNNFLNAGNGTGTQSIFIYNEDTMRNPNPNTSLFYFNVNIYDNYIYNGAIHGITVGDSNGVKIMRNTVVQSPDANFYLSSQVETGEPVIAPSRAPQISVSSKSSDVFIENNIVHKINAGINVRNENNTLIEYENRSSDNFIDKIFVNASGGGSLDPEAFQVRKGSVADTSNAGPAAGQPESKVLGVKAAYSVTTVNGDEGFLRFDAGASRWDGGALGADARFLWTFADGKTLSGRVVERGFEDHGRTPVTLTVIAPDGDRDSFTANAVIRDPKLLKLSFDNGVIADASTYGSSIALNSSPVTPVAGVSGEGLRMGSGTNIVVDRGSAQLYNLEQVSFEFALQPLSGGSRGGVISLWQSMSIFYTDDNELQFSMRNAAGVDHTLRTERAGFKLDAWNHVAVSYDSLAQRAEIFVNGVSAGVGKMTGLTKPLEFWGLTIGNPWGTTFRGGLDELVVRADPFDAAKAAAGHATYIGAPQPPQQDSVAKPVIVFDGDKLLATPFQRGIQDFGTATPTADGAGVMLTGNAWKQVMADITLREDSVLRFEFESSALAEIHGIGFAKGASIAPGQLFQLGGEQVWGVQDFNGLYRTGSGTIVYEIPVGRYLSGDFDRIVLVNDDDVSPNGVSVFRNVRITQGEAQADALKLDFSKTHKIEALRPGAQDNGQAVVSADGAAATLTGNAWKMIEIDGVVTEDTILAFRFKADMDAEIYGVGFVSNGREDAANAFQIAGTQSWGLQDFNNRVQTGDGFKFFEIPVGEYFTGPFTHLALIADDDADAKANATFADIVLYDLL